MNGKYKIRNFFGHLHTINVHRWKVFCLCCRVGIPFQGLVHDLSKYSFEEFFEGVKYFTGKYSPIRNCKEREGYSKAWLHHKGRNKHHYEYWYDYATNVVTPIIPFPYFLEMVCDTFAAGMTYQGKKWNQHYQLEYWNRTKGNSKMHPVIYNLLDRVYHEVDEKGLKPVLRKKYLRQLYDEYCNEE